MYQVLQVYTSFSFFDDFLSRSMKVGQSSSRRRRLRVAETSSHLFLIHLVSSRCRRRRGDVFLLENIFPRPTETRVANRSPTSLHASEIGALIHVLQALSPYTQAGALQYPYKG